jgi:hypothetical protein
MCGGDHKFLNKFNWATKNEHPINCNSNYDYLRRCN